MQHSVMTGKLPLINKINKKILIAAGMALCFFSAANSGQQSQTSSALHGQWHFADPMANNNPSGGILLAQLPSFGNGMINDLSRALGTPSREDPYSFAKKNLPSNAAPASNCMEAVKNVPKTGNSVVDTRCSLVAFEVCMNKSAGIISQSQDSKKQCQIIQELGGAAACQQPCMDATKLPVGGSGVVTTARGTYTGLTPFAVACYNKTKSDDVCSHNEALQCLMNASSSEEINSAIRLERKNSCDELNRNQKNHACTACSAGGPRVDFDPKKPDLDQRHCTTALAAAGHCAMPSK
jgi:hypothetical protein